MTDLVQRLRRQTSKLAQEAANEIERLQQELVRRDQQVLAGAGGVRKTDPSTSKVASATDLFGKENLRRKLLEAYNRVHPAGLTAWEVCQAIGETKNTASPLRRVYDLCRPLPDLGGSAMCEATGETRPGQSGAPMKVYKITDQGRAWLQRNPV